MIKWTLFVVLGLIGLVGLIALIGWFLPKGHRASAAVDLSESPDAVFATLTDFDGWPKWRSDVKRVDVFARDGKQFVRVTGADAVTYQIVETSPPQRLVTRIADELPYGGTWTWELAATSAGTTLTITEDGEIYHPIFRFIARLFMDPTASIRRCQGDLRAHLERPR